MKVAEKFVSINGEGQRAGELAVFIRFTGCNLRCSYCDTKWANEEDCPYEEMSPDEIYSYILSTGVKNVTLTGGEPLLHKGIYELVNILCKDNKINVEIETNGSVDIKKFKEINNPPSITLDYKTSASGMEDKMLMSNYEYLDEKDTVKFVSGTVEDLKTAKYIIDNYVKCAKAYISPVFGMIEPKNIVDFMIENNMNNARLQLQLHKFIWEPDMKGV